MSRDIIDAIDELVDEQLAHYDNRSGYDYNIGQDKCWHCGGDWHGLAVTEKIAAMRAVRTFDENYRYAEDASPVICPGSEFIGPLPVSMHRPRRGYEDMGSPTWIDQIIQVATDYCMDAFGLMSSVSIPAYTTPPLHNPSHGLRRGYELGGVWLDEAYTAPLTAECLECGAVMQWHERMTVIVNEAAMQPVCRQCFDRMVTI